MIEMSVTVTAGNPSEIHNHDLSYRDSLSHCHDSSENTVIELVPYKKTYKEQINDLMKPYIDEYNQKQDEKYQAAWDRYNAGLIKTKPRKRDYKNMGYDYYEDHVNDTRHNQKTNKEEKVPIFRGLIIGIGDKNDRQNLTEEQARKIFRDTLEDIKKELPCFKILGATLHLDEEGFYHMHLDYKPLYQRPSEAVLKGGGLSVGIGLDGALESLGFKPEQSIMNSRDKVPLLFNAMRNKIYHLIEKNMAEQQVRMQYGVSKIKDPGKDASKNQKLDDWKATQDAVRSLQHEKNVVLDIVSNPEVNEEKVVDAIESMNNIATQLNQVMDSPKSRIDKNKAVVEFRLLDQLKSFVNHLKETFAYLLNKLDILQENYNELQNDYDELQDNIKNSVVLSKVQFAEIKRDFKNKKDENDKLRTKLGNLENFVLNHSKLTPNDISNIEMGGKKQEKTLQQEQTM